MDTSYLQASEIREKLCKILYFCRGANVIVLTQLFNESLTYTQQQKKQMTNQLVRLKESGIVTSKRLEGKDAGSMYTLSTTGLELVYKLLNINPMQSGDMWQQYPLKEINYEQLKEYDYDTYKPPIRQHVHHHLILQSVIALWGKDSDLPSYPFRLTLDAVKKYMYNHQEKLLKPDAEVLIDNEIFTLEIDRSSESYAQLVAKFENYKKFLDHATKENIEPAISKIIFVYSDKSSQYGVARRWETIMKAFLEGMNIKDNVQKWPNVEVLYTKLSDLPEVVTYLREKKEDNIEYLWNNYYGKKVSEEFGGKEFKGKVFEMDSAIALGDGKSKLIYCAAFPFFTSDLYRQLIKFHAEGKNKFKQLEYRDNPKLIPIILADSKLQNWELNFKNTKVDADVQFKIKYILNLTKVYPLELEE